MPKMPKRRTLADVLEPGFAKGYDEFRELVDWSQDQSSLTKEQKAWAFCMERVSVGMIEALNAGEDRFEMPPHEMVVELWSAIGTALATINVQAFQMGPEVRRQMLQHLKASYDRAMHSFPERRK
ncbi:hypothetical protein EFV37_25240 [Mesorhizobium loti]|uniref:Uncharacterized protein n=1 Tax=Mesorhizobium jarvisii TaxID=1777867 RepID=A0A6M7TJQ7_9HYPH|nr:MULTISPECIES: hypothetical protein [Mesorhizobium]OBQ68377.1 hypothetical protein A9K72_08975 [Mesorhizobium loti]QKC65204.1 hypothetical protein EB229_25235 [Mesorhizobium jarvisii]QKD11119.1 hypothetical protein EFV37_25240 [Mesorhizobium loti]RJT31075.1 hypothetical protein D3242_22700 [Mesorhizobium jarvisii]